MEIITAGDGTAHVSSADDGSIYAGIIGPECYVTNVGDKLSCTMESANKALIGTGVGAMYGRMLRVTAPEEVTIESGTQNQRRNDIICAHFTTSAEGHESGELVVLKGTPTSGQEAEDPEIPDGDILDGATDAYMPLWRIPLDGINAGDPEAMFNILLPMAEMQSDIDSLRDLVSQSTDAKATQRYSDIEVTARHRAGTVTITVTRNSGSESARTGNDSDGIIGTVKTEYRPKEDIVALIGYKASSGAWLQCGVRTSGNVYIRHLYGQATELWASFQGFLTYAV